MDNQYLEYSLQDRWFYDVFKGEGHGTPSSASGTANAKFAPRPPSLEWKEFVDANWHYFMIHSERMPSQGWKIHVSATLENAQTILDVTSGYCFAHSIPFKCLKSKAELMRSNMKYAARSGSGKFITIYPQDDGQTQAILSELDQLLDGAAGPYILSDLRYHKGPLYVRYGGFKKQFVKDENGELVAAITDDEGRLVPDLREPRFIVPEWVQKPDFIQSMEKDLVSGDPESEFPYVITSALHFSNGGGVYLGHSHSDPERKLVLKEGRPHAGISPDGRDAVHRLENEYDFLEVLSASGGAVDIIDKFRFSEHLFLVEEYVEGKTLNKEMVARMPLIKANCPKGDVEKYRAWALEIIAKVERVLHYFHENNVVYGDLHPNNIIIREGNPVFIDFEASSYADQNLTQKMGAPGYVSADGLQGIDADLYALGCLKLALFLPLTTLIDLDSSGAFALIEKARSLFDLPSEYCQGIIENLAISQPDLSAADRSNRELLSRLDFHEDKDISELIDAVKYGISKSMQSSRLDRLFPGDPKQFKENGFGLSYGAAGIAGARCLQQRDLRISLDWIEDGVARLSTPNFGLYDGIAGAGLVSRLFGRSDFADEVLSQVLKQDIEILPNDLNSGLAGIGIYLSREISYAGSRSGAVLTTISDIRSLLIDQLEKDPVYQDMNEGHLRAATGRAGLLHGHTGEALFWIDQYRLDKNSDYLDYALKLINDDINLCVYLPDGSAQVNEGWRTLPYFATGSAGIAFALTRYGKYRSLDDNQFKFLDAVVKAATTAYVAQPNFFNGRAGLVYTLCEIYRMQADGLVALSKILEGVESLRTYACIHNGGIYFPGDQLLRYSTDFATGSAGVLYALRNYISTTKQESDSSLPDFMPLVPEMALERR